MQQRLPALLDPPIGFAHRGAKAYAQENTIEAFQLALRLGANGLESDVWLTSDGVAVLDHDGEFKAGLRTRRVADLRRDQLPSYMPSLAEVYEACGSAFEFSLDLKGSSTGAVVLATVAEVAPDALPRLWLCDPQWERLVPLREASADVKLVDSTRLAKIKEGVERRAATLREHGIDALNMHYSDWTGGMVTLVHRFDRYAFSWDIQQLRVLIDAFRMGCDAVFSDYPDRMMEAHANEYGALPKPS